jgi:hypothetical protein
MRLSALLFFCLSVGSFCAADTIGHIIFIEGSIQVIKEGQVRPIKISSDQLPYALVQTDSVKCKRNSQAHLKLTDHSKIVITERSKLRFKGPQLHVVESGRVLFKIEKQKGIKGLQVATKSAIIGVKGTEFLVDNADDKQAILLNEGEIIVDSIDNDFKRTVKKELSEYDLFLKNTLSEFSDYQTSMQLEFTEYVKSVSLTAGKAIQIDGNNNLTDISFTEADTSDFELLNSL